MGHNCLHVRFFLLDFDLDFTVAGLVTSLAQIEYKSYARLSSPNIGPLLQGSHLIFT